MHLNKQIISRESTQRIGAELKSFSPVADISMSVIT